MVQNNKVLTVSYGTFSCTLEGFDDSFETMKAIAEYFRDLAADDRYFGSEPPQPDAEMLARIAQRDQARRIEARQHDDGIVLRATETTPASAPLPGHRREEHRASIAIASTHRAAGPTIPEDAEEASEELSAPELAVLNPQPAAEPLRTAAQPRYEPEYEDEYEDEDEAEPVLTTPAPAADSIAAKLQRIRAVVSRADENAGQFSEDEESEYAAGETVDAISAAFAPPPAMEAAPAEHQAIAEHAPEAVDEAIPGAGEDEELTEPDTDPGVLVLETVAEAEDEQEILLADLETGAEAAAEDDTINQEQTDIEEPEAPSLRSEDAVLPDDGEEAGDMETPEGTLTAEDEADLLRKLSAVETELYARADSQRDANKEDDLSRLMAAADERLDDPSAGDSRQTYSHLRAAAAAAAAERSAGDQAQPQAADEEYREDLASVVSPRRPEVDVTSRRPAPGARAPLKLVAEQRIDTPDAEAEKGPVHPRRVASASEAAEAGQESGFARFAEKQGAQSLPDLLEAAAAYLSFVEGQEQFSRPQLMNKVRALQLEEFDREESLRSFGQLLRDGKIEKAGGGRFAASNQIGFRPDDKRAAG